MLENFTLSSHYLFLWKEMSLTGTRSLLWMKEWDLLENEAGKKGGRTLHMSIGLSHPKRCDEAVKEPLAFQIWMSQIVTVQLARDSLDIDFSLCLIFQKKRNASSILRKDVCLESLEKLKQYSSQRSDYGDHLYRKLCLLFNKEDPKSILEASPVYH